MPDDFLPGRCMADGCRKRATLAYKLTTPSVGYPIALGGHCASMFFTLYVCADHRDWLSRDAALTADAMGVVNAAFATAKVSAPPDFNRSTLITVPLTDAKWIAFANSIKRKNFDRRHAVGRR